MKTYQKETKSDLYTLGKAVIDLYDEVIFKWSRVADWGDFDESVIFFGPILLDGVNGFRVPNLD